MSASISDIVAKCLDTDSGYKQFSESVAAYVADTTKNVKLQQPIVNVVKTTVKSRSHSSLQKLLALRLLNKCVMKKNKEFNKYVEKKILKRLAIFAQYNKDKNTEQDITYKGEFIFSGSEKDRRSAAAFLVLLLDCMEQWSKVISLADDNKTPSQFVKSYVSLQQKKILFPSQCRNNPLTALGLSEEAKNVRNTQPQQLQSQNSSRSKSEYRKEGNPANNIQQKVDGPKVAEELKKKMLKAKEVSKKSETFLAKLERNAFQAEPMELIEMDTQLSQGKEQCEYCIQALTSESIGPIISNKEELLDRMLKYQEQILTSIAIIQPLVDNVKKQEKEAYKTFQNQKKTQVMTNTKMPLNTNVNPPIKQGGFPGSQPLKKNEEVKAADDGDLWSNLDQFATGFQSQSQQQQQQQNVGGPMSVFALANLQFPAPGQAPVVDKDDPFAEAILENYQKIQNDHTQPQQQNADDFFAGFNQQQQNQQYANNNNFNFDFPNQQQQPQPQLNQSPVQPQQPYGGYNESPSQQQIHHQNHESYPESNDHDLEPQLVQPEEEKIKVGGSDNYSVFKMLQEGAIDLEAERLTRKKNQMETQQQQLYQQQNYGDNQGYQQNSSYGGHNQYYDQQQQQQQHNVYQQQQPSYSQPNESYNQPRNLWDDGVQEAFSGGDSYQGGSGGGGDHNSRRIAELEKQVQSLKRQNTELLVSNHSLKERLESYKNAAASSNSYGNSNDLQLQNQQLEMQMNNMREYYDREIEQKEQLLQQKDYEISRLKYQMELMKNGNGGDQLQQEQYKSNGDGNDYSSPNVKRNHHEFQNSSQSANIIHEDPLEKKESSQEIKPLSARADSVESLSPDQDDSQVYHSYKQSESDKKIDSLFFKALFTEKMLIYEDDHIQIGCIRSISHEWRQATLKLFIGNKSTTQEVRNIYFQKDSQYINVRYEDKMPFEVDPKDQLEVQIYVGIQLYNQPFITFSYQVGDFESDQIKLKLPVNAIFFSEPFNVNANQFKQLWGYSKYPKSMKFNLNLTRAGNMQAVKKILTINEKHGAFIQGIDVKPNIVGFSGNHPEGNLFVILEISPTGNGCVLQVKSEVSEEFSERILYSFLDLLAAK